MNKILVTWRDNWADEIEGFMIIDKKEWELTRDKISKYNNELTIYVGTNEEIEYENGNMFLNRIETSVITSKEINVVEKFLGNEFGTFPLHQVLDIIDEENE